MRLCVSVGGPPSIPTCSSSCGLDVVVGRALERMIVLGGDGLVVGPLGQHARNLRVPT
jgi:hypothetical protein